MRRIVLLTAALLMALVGTGAVFLYVRDADKRALADRDPVSVLVAKGTIPAGMTAQEASTKGLLRPQDLPREAVPLSALSDVTSIRDEVAISDIFAGEILLRPKFNTTQATGALTIPAGKIAVSVELSDPARVAGFVVPGAEVAVFQTYDIEEVTLDANGNPVQDAAPAAATVAVTPASASASAAPAGAGNKTVVRPKVAKSTATILARVPVIAVGTTSLRPSSLTKQAQNTAGKEGEVTFTILTLGVDQEEAERLVQAANTGGLYFGLLNNSSETQLSPIVEGFAEPNAQVG